MALGALLFLPSMQLSGGRPGVMVLLDVGGLVQASVLALLYARVERLAAWWLLPLFVWMPLTLGFEIGLWLANP